MATNVTGDATESTADALVVRSDFLDLLAKEPDPTASQLEEVRSVLADRYPELHNEIGEAYNNAIRVWENARWRRRREEELSALYATARDLAQLHDVDDVLRAIVHRAHELARTDATYLGVVDRDRGDLYIRASIGLATAQFRDIRVRPHTGMSWFIIETGKPFWSEEYGTADHITHDPDLDQAMRGENLHATLGVPLVKGGEVLGVLFTSNRRPRPFRPEEVTLMNAFADSAAVALDNARTFGTSEAARRELQDLVTAAQRSEQVHEALTELVLQGGDMAALLDAVGSTLDASVAQLDAQGRSLPGDPSAVHTDRRRAKARAEAWISGMDESRRTGHAVPVTLDRSRPEINFVVAVGAGNVHLGALTISRTEPLSPIEMRTFERAAQIAALLRLREQAVIQAEERVRDELVTELLTTSRVESGTTLRAKARGLDLSSHQCVVAVEVDTVDRARQRYLLATLCDELGGLGGEHRGLLVGILPGTDSSAMGELLYKRVAAATSGTVRVVAGLYSPGSPLSDVWRAATGCLQIMSALSMRRGSATTDDMALFTVLFDGDRAPQLERMMTRVLGPLLSYDQAHRTELVPTLERYYRLGGSVPATAAELFVHANTVLKRLNRVRDVLGERWDPAGENLELRVALRLHTLSTTFD
jgi:sugar diacid utilization regulator